MTYRRDNRVRKYVQVYGFLSFRKLGDKLLSGYNKYGKKIVNRYYCSKKFSQGKYGQVLKNKETKIGKLDGKQLSDKIIPVAVDVVGSKIADKITLLKGEEPEKIIIPPNKRQ